MCRVLIIGAGGVGTVVAHKVAKNKVFTDIMLASRTKSKCDEIAAAVGGNRIGTRGRPLRYTRVIPKVCCSSLSGPDDYGSLSGSRSELFGYG